MRFDAEGHVVVTPREWQERLQDTATLTRDVWLVGTPWAFPIVSLVVTGCPNVWGLEI
jgi:hypothetical protein